MGLYEGGLGLKRRGSGPKRISHNALKENVPSGHMGFLTIFRMGGASVAGPIDCSHSGGRRMLGSNQNYLGQEMWK